MIAQQTIREAGQTFGRENRAATGKSHNIAISAVMLKEVDQIGGIESVANSVGLWQHHCSPLLMRGLIAETGK